MKELNKVFAENLTRLRKDAALTQLKLAEKLNYSDKAVSKWERGEAVPDAETLINLADLFGVSVDSLLRENSEAVNVNAGAKNKNLGLIVTLITFMGLMLSQIIVFMAISGAVGTASAVLYCIVYPLPVYAVAAIVFTAIWGKKSSLILSVATLVLILALEAFLLVGDITGQYYPLIFALIIPSEAIVYFSFRLSGAIAVSGEKNVKE